MTSSLRSRVVEAEARAWCEANGHFFDSCAWEEMHLVNAGLALDAMLDCLTENADEWAEETRVPLVVGGDVLALLAVLRNPE